MQSWIIFDTQLEIALRAQILLTWNQWPHKFQPVYTHLGNHWVGIWNILQRKQQQQGIVLYAQDHSQATVKDNTFWNEFELQAVEHSWHQILLKWNKAYQYIVIGPGC